MYTKYAGHGVQVVAVHVSETEAEADTWLTGLGVTFPAIQDTPAFAFMNSYTEGDFHVPRLYIIGRDWKIRYDHLGSETEDVIEGHLLDVIYLRAPVDLEMVMDVSDSMNSPSPSDPGGDSKLVMMKQAATMITDFLHEHGQTDDRMGLVWFTDDVSEYQVAGQKLFPIPINWATLRDQINAHGTGTCTAMGAGLQTAFDTLSASTQKRFAILCTDGMQNIEPKVTQVGAHFEIADSGGWLCGGHSSVPAHPGTDITTYDTAIHPIGIGITAEYATLLQAIADASGGFYRGTHDPETDLDLLYFVDLCNCLAAGSPALVHHHTGRFYPKECQAVESFDLNRSARKITVMLSWKKAAASSLAFWLYAPDGALLDLHQSMRMFESHCLATIYCPPRRHGIELQHVGPWRMVIHGETPGEFVDYHAFVIAEDREIKWSLTFPKKYYEVGDILPLTLNLVEAEKPIKKISEVILETARLRLPLAQLLAQYKVSAYELEREMQTQREGHRKDPFHLKLEKMAADPRMRDLFKPIRTRLSMKKGELDFKIADHAFLVPIVLTQPGLNSFKVSVHGESATQGPISRTDLVSVIVGPGKADPKQSTTSFTEVTVRGKTMARFRVSPKNAAGQWLGPGYGQELQVMVGRQYAKVEVGDQLDGSYLVELAVPKKRPTPVTVLVRGEALWKGNI